MIIQQSIYILTIKGPHLHSQPREVSTKSSYGIWCITQVALAIDALAFILILQFHYATTQLPALPHLIITEITLPLLRLQSQLASSKGPCTQCIHVDLQSLHLIEMNALCATRVIVHFCSLHIVLKHQVCRQLLGAQAVSSASNDVQDHISFSLL